MNGANGKSTPKTKRHENNGEVRLLAEEVSSLKDEINELRTLVKKLENKINEIDGKSLVSKQVSTLLRKEVDRLEQYGRRASLTIKGIPPNRDEDNNLKNQVIDIIKNDLGLPNEALDFDKTHRIGPIYDTAHGKKQDVIVRLKSHSARYTIYNKRKTCKNKNIRITPSLTERRRKLLLEAQRKYKDHPAVNFIYTDINGDLKVRLKLPVQNKFVHRFDDLDTIDLLFYNSSHEWDSDVTQGGENEL